MRVVVVTSPWTGHILPVLPLARALAGVGHEVRWLTGPDTVGTIESAGMVGVGIGPSMREYVQALAERYPQIRDLAPTERHPFVTPRMFAEIVAPSMLPDLLSAIEDWPPDVVVHEQGSLAAPIVAAITGLPKVTVGIGPCLAPSMESEMARRIGPLWQDHGLEAPAWSGLAQPLRIDICPPVLRRPDCEVCVMSSPMRPEPHRDDRHDGPTALPPGDEPLVYVTFGTVVNRAEGLRIAVQAIADLGVRALVTVGTRGDPTTFGPLPPKVRVERFVAQAQVMPHASVVVSHGGSGTMFGGLAHGIPQLYLPQAADQYDNAELILTHGAGLFLRPEETTVGAVQNAAQRLLVDPAFREAAGGIQRAIEDMPAATEVVGTIERFVRGVDR